MAAQVHLIANSSYVSNGGQPLDNAGIVAQIQARLTPALEAIAIVEAYNNGRGALPTALTLDDYVHAGITGVTADNLPAVNAQVRAAAPGAADTCPEIQAKVTLGNAALQKIEDYNNGTGTNPPALKIDDYVAAGVTGVTLQNLAAVNAQVWLASPGGAVTDPLIQARVTSANQALQKIEAYNNGDGATPVP